MVLIATLVLLASMGLFPVSEAADADPKKGDGTAVLVIERSGGSLVDPANPLSHYQLTVAEDGGWVLKAGRDAARKGKLGADALAKWLKEIEGGGLDKMKHNPALGAADEAYMDVTLNVKGKKVRRKVPLEEKLPQAIDKKVAEVVKPAK